MYPTDRRYSKEHEWIATEGDTVRVGITDFAQQELGDIVFVELPEAGKLLDQGDEAAVVESVKAASELYAPVAGTVSAVNHRLTDDPALVNSAPTAGGWFVRLTLKDPGELDALMDEAAPAEGTQVSIVCIDGESHTGTLHTVPLYDKEALIPRGKLVDIPQRDRREL